MVLWQEYSFLVSTFYLCDVLNLLQINTGSTAVNP